MNTQTQKRSIASHTFSWVVILFCALFLFYKYLLQVSPSVMEHEMMSLFHLDGAGLGNLAATYFYSYVVTQVFVGPLMDKFSAKWLATLAVFVCALGALFFANANTLTEALLARACMGVGVAFATINYMKMAAIWFKPERYALIGGLLATAVMAGSMVGEAPLAIIFHHFGWRFGMLSVAWFGFALTLGFVLFVRGESHRLAPQYAPSDTPTLRLKDFVGLLKKKDNWLLLFYSGLAFSPLAVFGGLWGTPFMQASFHVTKTMAATLTSMSFFGLGIGAPLLGYISDRLNKRFAVMMLGLVLSFVSIVLVIYVPPPIWLAGVLLFIFGFGVGAFMLGFTVGKELNSILLTASVIGLINTGDAIFGAFTEPLVGKVLDITSHGKMVAGVHVFSLHAFHLAFLLLPVYLVLAALFLLPLAKKC